MNSEDVQLLQQLPVDEMLTALVPCPLSGFSLCKSINACKPDDSPCDNFAACKLVITKNEVHKLKPGRRDVPEYVVSNLKTFNVEVALVDQNNQLIDGGINLGLRATLFFENGMPVPCTNEEPLLEGETDVVIIGGRATFRLKMGKDVLTHKMNKQRFRIRIAPTSDLIRHDFPDLTVVTEKLVSVTKLDRKPPPMPPAATQLRPATSTDLAQSLGEKPPASPPTEAEAQDAWTEGTKGAMELKIRAQRAEIALLTEENKRILEELTKIRETLAPAHEPPERALRPARSTSAPALRRAAEGAA